MGCKHARFSFQGTAPPAVGHLLPACGEKGNKREHAIISDLSAVATLGSLSPRRVCCPSPRERGEGCSAAARYTSESVETRTAPVRRPAAGRGEGTCTYDEVPVAQQRPASAKHARFSLQGTAPHPAVGHLLPACGEKGNKREHAVISDLSAVATVGSLPPRRFVAPLPASGERDVRQLRAARARGSKFGQHLSEDQLPDGVRGRAHTTRSRSRVNGWHPPRKLAYRCKAPPLIRPLATFSPPAGRRATN
jgi:hypothetical protein